MDLHASVATLNHLAPAMLDLRAPPTADLRALAMVLLHAPATDQDANPTAATVDGDRFNKQAVD